MNENLKQFISLCEQYIKETSPKPQDNKALKDVLLKNYILTTEETKAVLDMLKGKGIPYQPQIDLDNTFRLITAYGTILGINDITTTNISRKLNNAKGLMDKLKQQEDQTF